MPSSVKSKPAAAASSTAPQMVPVTHPEKVMFPAAGITKGELVAYYEQVAPLLLPHLRGRPITLERLPNGLAGDDAPRFWQKNTPAHYPAWIPRVNLPTEDGKPVHYALINDVETLRYMVNQGAVTFHVWMSRVDALDRPDHVLFDLDPGPVPFTRVVELAHAVREVLSADGHPVFIKTSGKSGLHLLTPWRQPGGYLEARAFATAIGKRVLAANPGLLSLEIRKDKRGGKIYLDIMQNVRGHHVVPAYVLRAVPNATVSTPLHWAEVTPDLDPARFTRSVVLERAAAGDPLSGVLPP